MAHDKLDLSAAEGDDVAGKMSFLDHLDELRKRLIWAVASIGAGFAITFPFIDRIFDFIMLPMQRLLPHGQTLIYTDPGEALTLEIKIALITGLLIASPLVFLQLWLFVAPGLYSHEKKWALPFIVMSSLFFILGAAFSHYVAFPWTWKFFLGWQTEYMEFRPSIGEAFGLYVKMLLGFGLIFQMPTIVYFLSRLGLVTAGFLLRHTKYAVLIIFIIAAVISPGTDVVSQCLMAGPMLALYGLSIVVAWFFAKPRSAE